MAKSRPNPFQPAPHPHSIWAVAHMAKSRPNPIPARPPPACMELMSRLWANGVAAPKESGMGKPISSNHSTSMSTRSLIVISANQSVDQSGRKVTGWTPHPSSPST